MALIGSVSGSHTTLGDGSPYIIAGPNVTIVTGSSGALLLSASAPNYISLSGLAGGIVDGTPVYFNGSSWVAADASDANKLAVGIANNTSHSPAFDLYYTGKMSLASWPLEGGAGPLTPDNYYFVSTSTPGKITSTTPTTAGYYSNPIIYAISSTDAIVLQYRPSQVASGGGGGGGSSYNPLPVMPGTLVAQWVLNDMTPVISNYIDNLSAYTHPSSNSADFYMPSPGSPEAVPTPYGGAPYFESRVMYSTSDGSSIASTVTSTYEPANFTLSFLVNLQAINTGINTILWGKMYNAGTAWNDPWAAFQIALPPTPSTLGNWSVWIATGGAGTGASHSMTTKQIPLNRWTMVTVTSDGTTLSGYINGALSDAHSVGPISYGNHGPFYAGNYLSSVGSNGAMKGALQLMELNSVALNSTQVASYYSAVKSAMPLLFLP